MIKRSIPTREAAAIVADVACAHGVPETEILSDSRRRDLTAARRDVYSRMFDLGVSYNQIGRLMQRHHTTVMFALGAA